MSDDQEEISLDQLALDWIATLEAEGRETVMKKEILDFLGQVLEPWDRDEIIRISDLKRCFVVYSPKK